MAEPRSPQERPLTLPSPPSTGARVKRRGPGVTGAPSGVACSRPLRAGLFRLPQRGDRLPPGEADVQLVPVADPLLAQLPAQAHVPPLVAAGEADQPDAVVLQVAPDL